MHRGRYKARPLYNIVSRYLDIIEPIGLFPVAYHHEIEAVNSFNQSNILKWEIRFALLHEVETTRRL